MAACYKWIFWWLQIIFKAEKGFQSTNKVNFKGESSPEQDRKTNTLLTKKKPIVPSAQSSCDNKIEGRSKFMAKTRAVKTLDFNGGPKSH